MHFRWNTRQKNKCYLVQSSWVQFSQVELIWVELSWVESSHVESSRVEARRVELSWVESSHVKSCQVESHQVQSSPVQYRSGQVNPFQYNTMLYGSIQYKVVQCIAFPSEHNTGQSSYILWSTMCITFMFILGIKYAFSPSECKWNSCEPTPCLLRLILCFTKWHLWHRNYC